MRSKTILILGATSSIACAIAAEFARLGYALFLAARDTEELSRIAADLRIRFNATVDYACFNAEDFSNHDAFFQKILCATGNTLIGVVFACGYLGATPAQSNNQEAIKIININLTGAVGILNICADYLARQNEGFIIGIASVAGDRGRQSNYIYGAAKSGFTVYLQGLRQRLYKNKVKVITIKPGFVDTKMIYGRKGVFLAVTPRYVGKRIVRSLMKNQAVSYIPWFWRWIMGIIKLIPETIFKRLKF